MPTEPSIVSASRRYWYVVILGTVLAVLSVFIFDAAQTTRHRAESGLVLRQPLEIGSDIARTERFALEQAQILASSAVAARAAEKLTIDQRSVLDSVSVLSETDSSLVVVQYTVEEQYGQSEEARELALAGVNAVVDSYLEISGQIAAEELRITEAVVDVQLGFLVQAIGDMYNSDLDATGEAMVEQLQVQRGRTFARLSRSQTNALRRANPLAQRVLPEEPFEVRLAGNKINLAMAFAIGTTAGGLAAYAIAMRQYFAAGGAYSHPESASDHAAEAAAVGVVGSGVDSTADSATMYA